MATYDSELAFSAATKPPNFLVLSFWFSLTSKHQTENTRNMGLYTVTATEASQNISKKLQTRGQYRKLQVIKHCVYKEYWFPKKKNITTYLHCDKMLMNPFRPQIPIFKHANLTRSWQATFSKQLRSHWKIIFKSLSFQRLRPSENGNMDFGASGTH